MGFFFSNNYAIIYYSGDNIGGVLFAESAIYDLYYNNKY